MTTTAIADAGVRAAAATRDTAPAALLLIIIADDQRALESEILLRLNQ